MQYCQSINNIVQVIIVKNARVTQITHAVLFAVEFQYFEKIVLYASFLIITSYHILTLKKTNALKRQISMHLFVHIDTWAEIAIADIIFP